MKRENADIGAEGKKIAIIVRKDLKGEIEGARKVELDTKLMDVYINDFECKKIQIINCY